MRTMTISAVVLGFTSYATADQQQKLAMVDGVSAFHASLATVCDNPDSACRSVAATVQAFWRAGDEISHQRQTTGSNWRGSDIWRAEP